MTQTPRTSGVFSLGALGGDGAASGDANWSDVVLLLDGTSATTDKSGHNNLTNNGAAVSTATGPYSSTHIEFDGSDHLSATSGTGSSHMLGTGDWTVETWARFDNFTDSWCRVWEFGPYDASGGFRLNQSNTTGQMVIQSYLSDATGTTALSTATWYHLAVTREGDTFTLYLDGQQEAQFSHSSYTLDATAFRIGAGQINASDTGTNNFITGDIADFRVTKGVARDIAADWTAGVYNSALPQGAATAAATRPTRRWGGMTGRSLVESDNVPTTGVLSLPELLQASYGGSAYVEADPGGFLYAPTSNQTVTLTVDASVSVVTASGSGFLIPTSSNYCIVALGVGGNHSNGTNGNLYYHDGGAGGSLAYYNGLTVADGDTFEISTGPSGSTIVQYNGNSNSISIAQGSNRTPSTPSCVGTFATATAYNGGQGGAGPNSGGGFQAGDGGDAALFTQNGASAGQQSTYATNGDGGKGTDLYTGAQTSGSSTGAGANYGGGAGGRAGVDTTPSWNPDPGNGAIRILWGLNRAFPSTNQGNSSALPNGTADYVHTP